MGSVQFYTMHFIATTLLVIFVAAFSKCMILCDVAPQNINELFLQVAKAGELVLVKQLILDPNLCDLKLNWALMEAARSGNIETVRFLLLDQRIDSFGVNFSIMRAVTHDNIELVKMLLADPRAESSAINSSLPKAAHIGNIGMFNLFYKDPRVTIAGLNNALNSAASAGRMEIFKILFKDPRVDPSANRNNPLRAACVGNHYDIAIMLLHHPDVDPHFANILRADWMHPKRAQAIRLAQTSRQFYENTLVQFIVKKEILERLQPDEFEMLLSVNKRNFDILTYLYTFTKNKCD